MNSSVINIVSIEDQNYTVGFEDGYDVCKQHYQYLIQERKRMRREVKRQRLYFLKQKTVGLLMLVLTGLGVMFLDGDATIAIITVPISGMLLFSKEMCWMNRYYWEVKERDNNGLSI